MKEVEPDDMERSSLKLMAAAMLISVMLSGCGAKDDSQSGGAGQAANGANAGQAADQGADGSANRPQQPDRTADYFAKVVSVSGDAIVVQKSTMSPADMPSFGGRGGQRPQGGDGAQGQGQGGGQRGNWQGGGKPNGDGAQGRPAEGQAGNGQGAPAGGQNGGGPGRGGGGFMNEMKFEDAQTTVPVNADTQIVKFGRGQNGMTTDAMKATDLQAGDILMVWLGADSKTAAYIRLSFNPANMGNAGKAGNGQ